MNNEDKDKTLAEPLSAQPTSVPTEVLANRDIEKKKYEQEMSANNTSKVPEKKEKKPSFINRIRSKKGFRKAFFALAAIFTLFVFCLGSLFFLTVTNLDTSIFKVTLKGIVTDKLSGAPVAGAEIYVDEVLKTTTNEKGNYSIGGLNIGSVSVKIVKEDYQELVQPTPITRLFLSYTTTRNFELTPKERATITGKLVSPDSGYKFVDEKVLIDEDTYDVEIDGTFKIEGVIVGERKLTVTSLNYLDLSNEINVAPGLNELRDIELSPSGDIEGSLKSYVREDLVTNPQFEIENLDSNQIVLGNETFKIKDLEIGREYAIRVKADGYMTRDYKITIKQGLNQLFDFRLVEEGTTVYLKEDSETKTKQLFTSDFDGLNLKRISSFKDGDDVYSYYYDSAEGVVYYQSVKDRVNSSLATGNLRLVYKIDIKTLVDSKVTTNTTTLGTLTASYIPKKLISVSKVRSDNITQNKISISDFNGENSVDLKITKNAVASVLLSDDGKYLFYRETVEKVSTIYRIDISSKEEKKIAEGANVLLIDATSNGDQLIYTNTNQETTFVDLLMFNFQTQEVRTLDDNFVGKSYQFVNGVNDEYLYFMEKASQTNLYKNVISENKEVTLTDLKQRDAIQSIFQQSGYTYYVTKDSLYIIDINKPLSYKVVYSF